jgi:hypothetical protein
MGEFRKSSLLAYWTGLGLAGAAVGYFVGFSESPVIATLLPLLFGVLGTGGIVVVGKADLQQVNSRDKLKRVGIGLSVFSLTIILSSAAALVVKNARIGSGVHEIDLSGASAARSIQLLALRKMLDVLGATAAEQRLVLSSAMASTSIPAAEGKIVQSYLKEVVASSKQVVALTESLMASGQISKTEKNWERIQKLQPILMAVTKVFDQWSHAIEAGAKVPYFGITKQIELLEGELGQIVGTSSMLPTTSMETLSNVPELYSALISLRMALIEERPVLVAVEASGMPLGEKEASALVERLLTSDRGQPSGPSVHFFATNLDPLGRESNKPDA